MITGNDEYYYSVSGLMVPRNQVTDTLNEDIERFVDWVPRNTQVMEALANNDHINIELFTRRMDELYELLCAIYANWLKAEAVRILKLVAIDDGDMCRRLIMPFLSNVRTLALDIQMAQNKGFVNSYRQREEIEAYRSVLVSLRVLPILLENSYYEKAYDIVLSIDELKGTEHAKQIIDCIAREDPEGTARAINEIIGIYTEKINAITDAARAGDDMKMLLIVDDMPEILTAIRHMLAGHYQVVGLTDGNEALSFIDGKKKPDAFLLDIDMPDMDGFTLAEKIREREHYKTAPIMFLTSNSTRLNLIKALKFGIKAFIVKPAYKDILISKLSDCF